MTGPDEKPKGSIFDALRDRSRVVSSELSGTVPRGLRVATAYSWRFLVVAAAVGVLIWLNIQLKLLVIPLMIAILITALLWPVFAWMLRHRVPRWLAITISVIGTLAIVSGLLWLAIWQITRQYASVQTRTIQAVSEFRDYLIAGPLHLTETQIDDLLAQLGRLVQEQGQLLWSGALAIGSTLGHVGVGALLSLFILLCCSLTAAASGAGPYGCSPSGRRSRWTAPRGQAG